MLKVSIHYQISIFSPVVLIGGETPSSGNVYAINTNTGIYGPVCDDNWDIEDVSLKY